MRAFFAFLKKELLESWRTYKLIVMAATFIFLGILSPLTALIFPDLLSRMMETSGIVIAEIPEATAFDSWMQFFGNIAQLGMIILIIVFSGIMANEFSKGTLVNVLTKGMKRHTVIAAKFSAAMMIWTVCYLLSFAVAYGYTSFLWEDNVMQHAFLAFAGPWSFGVMMIALLFLGGIWFKTFFGSLLFGGGSVIVMLLLGIIPQAERYNPISIAGGTVMLLNGTSVPADVLPALIVCIAATVTLMVGSVLLFKKKQV